MRCEQFSESKVEGNFELQRTDTSKEIYPCMFLCQIEAIVYLWSIKYFCLHDLSQGFKGLDIPQLKLGHYLFLEAHSFPWALLSKHLCILEQIISANKYPCIFSCQKKDIVYILWCFYTCWCVCMSLILESLISFTLL